MTAPTWLKVVMAIGVGASAATTAITAGPYAATLVGISAACATLAGLFHHSPREPPPPPAPPASG